ncbi:hypothetical protein [Streptomyces sp. bgisy022]|uniref:hypothetical protein n=1 Tax=Streptomyces sp. bgisy022 TaxID=3413769 RepID=UPI003D72B069
MPSARARLLYVTDLAYPARGRRYCDEDIFLTSRLRDTFDLALCHPRDAAVLLDGFDAVVTRNSGPVLYHQDAHDAFRARAAATGVPVYNPLTGRGDMAGKQYLLDLTAAGEAVIPTVDRAEDLPRLPRTERYVVKPRRGADSVGLRVVTAAEVPALVDGETLVQPLVDFAHEVSFYFVDDAFRYALYAPEPDRRWQLRPFRPSPDDLAFARHFVRWNTLAHGIQRVDACRTRAGDLLLVELEDHNPYLSLDALDDAGRDAFVAAMTTSLHRFLDAHR